MPKRNVPLRPQQYVRLCDCSCGQPTPICIDPRSRRGIYGQPLDRFTVGHRPLTLEGRYEVTEGGCWEWLGKRNRENYGRIHRSGRWLQAHRVSYELQVGPIPDGLHLDHLCRNPPCINPDHLEPVTSGENTRRGLMAKLTAEQIDYIRASKERSVVLGERFGVSRNTIWRARSGRTWGAVA